jgi:photosystem II stability/assembly factor-like uncharacterized protein
MRSLAALALAVTVASAQAPVRVPFECTADDLDRIGQNCSNTQPCPVYLELSALDVVGQTMFLSGNLHTETSTLASLLLGSPDGGRTWSEPHPRIPGAGLDQIQFIDFELGWVAGATLSGRPGDPFLLSTTDGGKTWRQQPVFDGTHPGAIERFWFDSRTHGLLLVDRGQPDENGVRHELCETMTGGGSWELKEASAAPIALKGIRAANPDWRLRADGRLKAYQVERQQAARWVAVATFPVQVGECRSVERELAAPPPEDGRSPN